MKRYVLTSPAWLSVAAICAIGALSSRAELAKLEYVLDLVCMAAAINFAFSKEK